MADMTKKYWLKLEDGFLDSGHIKVLKAKENGKDLILFYLAIMLKSIRDVGHLKFSDTVPYDEEMLAAVTDTGIETVRQATANLKSLGLLEVLENGTMFLTDMPNRVGRESDSYERVRAFRSREKEKRKPLQGNAGVTVGNGGATFCNGNKEEEKEVDLEEEKKQRKRKVKPPDGGDAALDSVISQYTSDEGLKTAVNEFIKMRKLKRKPVTDTALKQFFARLDKLAATDADKIEIFNRSTQNGWTSIWPLETDKQPLGRALQPKPQINYNEED
ncbi:MAG: phage replisome organizer N-terminal domain-containing protein [Firmicutes bacterium]|nr:phage replisome organizer N-terminal domain-containing protein [Bacillota bacterium]